MLLPDDISKEGTDSITKWHSLKAFIYMGDNACLVGESTVKFLLKAERMGEDSTSCVFSFFPEK